MCMRASSHMCSIPKIIECSSYVNVISSTNSISSFRYRIFLYYLLLTISLFNLGFSQMPFNDIILTSEKSIAVFSGVIVISLCCLLLVAAIISLYTLIKASIVIDSVKGVLSWIKKS